MNPDILKMVTNNICDKKIKTMDKSILTDTLDTIKERLSSPVFGTFFISFLLYNWEIPVGLFLPIDQLKSMCYNNYFDLIESHTKIQNFFWPLFFTIFYAFGFPWIKNLISALNDLSEKTTENWWLEKAKGKLVPFEKYFKLREDYKTKIDQLDAIMQSESAFLESNTNLTKKNLELEKKIADLVTNFNKIEQNSSKLFFNGIWFIESFCNTSSIIYQKYFFDNDSISIVDNNGFHNPLGKIKSLSYDTVTRNHLMIILVTSVNVYYAYEINTNALEMDYFRGQQIFGDADIRRSAKFKRE